MYVDVVRVVKLTIYCVEGTDVEHVLLCANIVCNKLE